MAILNYTTSIDFEKTIAEITKCLVKHGATKITTDYDDQIPVSVTFCLNLNEKLIPFSLPANYNGVLKAMRKDHNCPRKLLTKEQALRVSWRIIKVWVEAQMAIVEAELADMAEVFLPYAVTPSGKTFYKEVEARGMLMLGSAE